MYLSFKIFLTFCSLRSLIKSPGIPESLRWLKVISAIDALLQYMSSKVDENFLALCLLRQRRIPAMMDKNKVEIPRPNKMQRI